MPREQKLGLLQAHLESLLQYISDRQPFSHEEDPVDSAETGIIPVTVISRVH